MYGYYSVTPYSDELYHWGVKGMKWGVRRYQNKDGSLTDAGRKRLADRLEKKALYNDYGWLDYDQWRASSTREIKKLHEDLKEARSKLYESMRLRKNFNDNDEVLLKHCKKHLLEENDEIDFTDSEILQWAKEDVELRDIAFTSYLREKNIDPAEYRHVQNDAHNKYAKQCKKAVEKTLGAYGDKVIRVDEYGVDIKVKDVAEQVLDNLLNRERDLYGYDYVY